MTQIIRDGFDSKDDHEFMHDVRQYYAYRSMQRKIPGYFREIGMF